ncbi:hypothetical protein G6F68_020167 [Rhizopus microsporus]|nr:hypothetical protein G6F68_020167 [Rhizopus microsporus]
MLAQQLPIDATPVDRERRALERKAAGDRAFAAARTDLHRRRHAIALVLDADTADIPRRVVVGNEADPLVDRFAVAPRQHAQPQ